MKEPIEIDVQKISVIRCPKCEQWMQEHAGVNEYSTTAKCILCDIYVQLKWNVPVKQVLKMHYSF